MLKKLSGLDDERLAYYLARVREIQAHDEAAALIETDKLIWEIWEEDLDPDDEDDESSVSESEADAVVDADDDYIPNDLEHAEKHFEVVERNIAENTATRSDFSYLDYLYRHAVSFAANYPRKRDYQDRLAAITAKLPDLLQRGAASCFNQELQKYQQQAMPNLSATEKLFRQLDESITRFTEAGNTLQPDHEAIIRQIRYCGALSRAEKKIKSAEVQEAAHQFGRELTLRREALAVLKQDWETSFPGEPVPEDELKKCRGSERMALLLESE